MITDWIEKPLTKDLLYREGKVYCKLAGAEISVMIFDEEVTVEYAERCAAAMNAMPEALIDAICWAAKAFCIDFCESISDEWRAELKLAVPVNADTPPRDLLKCFRPTVLTVELPEDETPYERVPQGHPTIVDYFYHEEVRGTANSGKRNK